MAEQEFLGVPQGVLEVAERGGPIADPADLTATIYHCLGIDPHRETPDQSGRPFTLSKGDPIEGVLA